jgi:hypothetical protein
MRASALVPLRRVLTGRIWAAEVRGNQAWDALQLIPLRSLSSFQAALASWESSRLTKRNGRPFLCPFLCGLTCWAAMR